jgi:nucleotide-binding universal stress UspA family protein
MSTIAAMKILLAADGSKYSIDAVKFLTSHINWVRERPELELLYVHPPLPKLSGLGAVIGKKQLQQYYDEEGAEALAAARQILDGAKIPYAAHVLVGPPAETIVAHAKRMRADMLLIGHRGASAAANAVMGSVAAKLLQLSPIPVLLVK